MIAGASAAVAQPPSESATAPAPEQQVERAPERFAIYAIDVSGVTRLTAPEIERIIYPFVGPDKSGADVDGARAAIQQAYVERGFEAVVVEIPAQTTEVFAQGVITIQVSEAPVGAVKVVDAKFSSPRGVRTGVASLKEGEPLNLKLLQRDLEAANRRADRQITPSFKPGATPGTLDVELKVDDKVPLHSTFELNNDNSPSTTRLRLSGSFRHTDLWNLGHILSGSFLISPERRSDSSVISGSYLAPIGGTPWSVLLFGYKSNSNIAALGGTNVLGDGYQIGARAIYRLPATDSAQSISFGVDFKDFKQDIFVGPLNAASTPIRYVPMVVEYNVAGADDESPFAKRIGSSSFDANIGATIGLRAIKRSICFDVGPGRPCIPVDQFQNREIDAFENFVHFNAGFNHSLATKSDFVFASRWSVQFADSHLVTNEQFAIGGGGSVRGYFQSEAVGDDGFASGFELQAPSLSPLLGGFVDELRLYGFVDSGFVRVRSSLPGQQAEFGLLGAGGGARLRLFDRLSGEVIVAVPLKAGPVSREGDVRTVFVVRGEF